MVVLAVWRRAKEGMYIRLLNAKTKEDSVQSWNPAKGASGPLAGWAQWAPDQLPSARPSPSLTMCTPSGICSPSPSTSPDLSTFHALHLLPSPAPHSYFARARRPGPVSNCSRFALQRPAHILAYSYLRLVP